MPFLTWNLESGDAGKATPDRAWQLEIRQSSDNLRVDVLVGKSRFEVCSYGATAMWDFRVAGSRKRLCFSGWWWRCEGGHETREKE